MRVLHISTYDVGGAGIACLRLHEALQDAGHESRVLVLSKLTDHPGVTEIWENHDALWKTSQLVKQRALARKQEKTVAKLGEVKEKFSFPNTVWNIADHELIKWADVIQLHWVADFLNYESFFAKCTKPIVWSLHDFAAFSGGFHYPQKQGTWRTLEEQNLALKQKALASANLQVVTTSRYLLEHSKKGLFEQFPHQFIGNGLNTSVFAPRPALGQTFVLGGAFEKIGYDRKGGALFQGALNLYRGTSLHVLMAGEAPELNWVTNRDIIIQEKGILKGDKELAAYYNSVSCMVCPSIDDNSPNVIMEAHCCGVPVIGFNRGGVSEMIEDGVNGILCKDTTPESLCEGIMRAMETTWNREVIAQSAKERYNAERMAEEYISLYELTLSQNR